MGEAMIMRGGSSTKVVDNLTSTDADKALSANQGKKLNDTISKILSNDIVISANSSKFSAGPVVSNEAGIAIGDGAQNSNGVAIGTATNTGSYSGVAIGINATATEGGVAIGHTAHCQNSSGAIIDAVQLGTGDNNTEKTFQVYNYRLMNADGTIPAERMTSKVSVESGKSLIDENVASNLSYNSTDSAIDIEKGKVIRANTHEEVTYDGETYKTDYYAKMDGQQISFGASDAPGPYTVIGGGLSMYVPGYSTTEPLVNINTTQTTFKGINSGSTVIEGDSITCGSINGTAPINESELALRTVNNLEATSNDSKKLLAAPQGKILNDKITTVSDTISALPIKSLEGQTVSVDPSTTVTAGTGATIIGDLRNRIYNSLNRPSAGNVASGNYSVAIGSQITTQGTYSLAGGNGIIATKSGSISLGVGITNEGQNSIVIGSESKTTANRSVVIGHYNTASGSYGAAMGYNNTTLDFQFKIGKYAKEGTAGTGSGTTGDAFIIGNGTSSSALSNAFRVTYAGGVYGISAYNSSGADYAEYFEWVDGNTKNEDRRGRFVTLDGEKIKLATDEDDYILGVVSATPCVKGDSSSEDWNGKYLTDEFGQRLTQKVTIPAKYEEREKYNEETKKIEIERVLVEEEYEAVQWILNPDYNPEQEYIPREARKEWSAIGMVGKLILVDDGTCEVNGYCGAGKEGIATKKEKGYRVMSRIDENHIKVLIK